MRFPGNNLACASSHEASATREFALPWENMQSSFNGKLLFRRASAPGSVQRIHLKRQALRQAGHHSTRSLYRKLKKALSVP